jgi:pterin-4a-carbinolamine dehydratase
MEAPDGEARRLFMSQQNRKDQQLEAVTAEGVQEELKTMPAWRLAPDGKAIGHTRELLQAAGAAKFAGFVADLAAVDHQPVHLGISGNRVLLTLPHRNGTSGLTAAVFDFARQLG